jgi:hypothetical protein
VGRTHRTALWTKRWRRSSRAATADGSTGYDWSRRSIKYHRAQVWEASGFRESTVVDEQRWAAWLQRELCQVELSEDRV